MLDFLQTLPHPSWAYIAQSVSPQLRFCKMPGFINCLTRLTPPLSKSDHSDALYKVTERCEAVREVPKDVLKMASGLISPSGHRGQLCIVLVCATDCFLLQLLCCIESLCWVIRAVSCMPAYIAITTSSPTIMQSVSIQYPAIFIQKKVWRRRIFETCELFPHPPRH